MNNKILRNFLFLIGLFPAMLSAQCLPGWTYSMPITITNSNASILTNFQVKVNVNTAALIGAGQMLANGNDIRFTDGSCNTIHYWIESGLNTASTSIWVKVPTIPASGSTTIYMYYNNVSAPAVASGDSVFLFFDDFIDASLNLTKWTVRGTPSVLTESGSILTLVGNSNWEYIRSNTTWNGPVVIESREMAAGPSAAMVLGYAGTDNRFTFRLNSTLKGTTWDNDVSGGNAWFDQNYPGVPHPTSGYNNFEVKTDLVANVINVSSFCDVTTSNCNTTLTALNQFTGTGYYLGFSTYAGGYTEYVDWVFARSAVPISPTTGNGPPQNNVTLTSSLSSTTYCAGSNLNVDFNAGGSYLVGNVFTAELSDAAGSFISPVAIGSLVSSLSGVQTLAATIPVLTASGSGYRVRVVSSSPVVIGSDNGINITINSLPAVAVTSSSTSVCIGSSVTLTGSGATSYSWSSGGTTAMETVTPTVNSTYTVTGTDANSCVNTATISVIVNVLPVVTATAGSGNICIGSSEILTASGATTYSWSSGGSATTEIVSPTISTTYTVTGTDANSCVNTATIAVVVNALPVVSLGSDFAQCAGSYILDAQNAGSSFLWSDASTGQTLTVSTSGTYSVVVTDANGCIGNDVINATFNSLPIVNLGADVIQCAGTILFDAQNAGATYLWSDASTGQTLTVATSGTYSVTVTDINGCNNSDVVIATINPLPIVDLGADTTNCGAVSLDAGNMGSFYLWNNATTSQLLIAIATGTYYVGVTDVNGCMQSDTINVTVNTPPVVTATSTSSVVCLSDASVALTGTPTGGTWNGPGVTGSSFQPSSAGVGAQTINYLYTDVNGCDGLASVVITVNACVGMNEQTNISSINIYPNPSKGEFVFEYLKTESATVTVYDAQGKKVQELLVLPGEKINMNITISGIYMLDVITVSGEHQTLRVAVNN